MTEERTERTRAEDISATHFMRMKERMAKLEELADERLQEADTDELTGLLNKRGLRRRTFGRDWGFFVVADLNGFKVAQDAHKDGHAHGDLILAEFAEYLVRIVRDGELRARATVIARTGGDEFTVWTETRACARRMRDEIRAWHSAHGNVTASAGMGADQSAADAAMYLHKTKGE